MNFGLALMARSYGDSRAAEERRGRSGDRPRFPTTVLTASGSKGVSHPGRLASEDPQRVTLTLIELWDNCNPEKRRQAPESPDEPAAGRGARPLQHGRAADPHLGGARS